MAERGFDRLRVVSAEAAIRTSFRGEDPMSQSIADGFCLDTLQWVLGLDTEGAKVVQDRLSSLQSQKIAEGRTLLNSLKQAAGFDFEAKYALES